MLQKEKKPNTQKTQYSEQEILVYLKLYFIARFSSLHTGGMRIHKNALCAFMNTQDKKANLP